jgi:large subunit ribosomal protein L25
MDQVTLHAEVRTEKGSRATRRLRRSGQVPAVVYGRGLDPLSVIVDEKALFAALHTEAGFNALISVDIDGDDSELFAVAREIQRDPVRDDITHLDLIKVSLDEEIESEVPVHYEGTPDAVREEGALIETIETTVLVSSLPTAVPSSISVDIGHLEIGDTVTLADLPAIEGVTYVDEEDRPLLTVLAPRMPEEEEVEVDAELLEGEELPEDADSEAEGDDSGGDEDEG